MSDHLSYDVFLSHSSKDKVVVGPLAERLRKDGLKVWLNDWEIKPGDSIPANRVKQIVFTGERFDAVSVQNWRRKVLGS